MSIVLWEIPDFVIDQTAIRSIDERSGEIKVNFEGKGISLGKMPLLFKEDGESLRIVNNWLIHLKANLRKTEVNTQAQGLLHFFSFLKDINVSWDDMPIPSRLRPTYAFKKHLKEAYKNNVLARSTANSYMRVVVNFYKHYLIRKYPFKNPPFLYETIKVKSNRSHEYMQNSYIQVDTTDLRLNLPQDSSFYGLSRQLVPLSEKEWEIVDRIYRSEERAVSNSSEGAKAVSISQEFKIAVALSRFSGLRREELVTLRSNAIYKPDTEQLAKKYLIHSEGLLLDPRFGVKTKNGTVRRAEISSRLMKSLHEYINSERYILRKKLYQLTYPLDAENSPLLITQTGTPYSGNTLNARWGELRNAVRIESSSFDHKFHNLRSTYAVFRLKELLNSGLKEAEALDYLQAVMGHKHRATLLGYLKFCTQDISANQVYEDCLDVLLES